MCENVCLQVLSTCCDSKDALPPHGSIVKETAVKCATSFQPVNQDALSTSLTVLM